MEVTRYPSSSTSASHIVISYFALIHVGVDITLIVVARTSASGHQAMPYLATSKTMIEKRNGCPPLILLPALTK